MLVATRDPSHQTGAASASASSPGFSRLMNVLQVAGALLAIPAGLASAYSIYHADFSVEARCQGLRGSIVSMLDKNVDASTLRMLIGRDVTTFERSCGTVDPEAVAAFKRLLAAKPAVAQSAPARPPAAPVKPAEARPLQREASSSDARWLAAVRGALVRHHGEPSPPVETATVVPVPPPTPPIRTNTVPAPVVAPVASVPVAVDHPVPPALIPEATLPTPARGGDRLGRLIAHLRGLFGP